MIHDSASTPDFRQVSYDSELHWCWVKLVAAPVTKPVTVKCIIST